MIRYNYIILMVNLIYGVILVRNLRWNGQACKHYAAVLSIHNRVLSTRSRRELSATDLPLTYHKYASPIIRANHQMMVVSCKIYL
jgi:hypothetical protein